MWAPGRGVEDDEGEWEASTEGRLGWVCEILSFKPDVVDGCGCGGGGGEARVIERSLVA